MAALLTHPQRPSEDFLSGFSQTPSFRRRLAPSASSVMPELAVGSGGTVYVAVGKSADKTAALLRWTFSMFPGQEVCLLHVHRPSLFIPTLLGKLPASRANPETVAAFRNEEREETKKLLSSYLLTCSRSRVNASIITTEAAEVQKGIVNLINLRTIRKLVVGAIPDFMKGKRSSCKACSVSKHAPSCCEIWFVYKGKLVWTRQASSSSSMSLPICQFPASYTHNLRCRSLNSCQTEVEATQTDIRLSIPTQCVESSYDQKNAHDASSSTSLGSSNVRTTCASSLKTKEEGLCVQVAELESEVDKSKDEAYLRLEEQKHLKKPKFNIENRN